jgi:hypothetical protein
LARLKDIWRDDLQCYLLLWFAFVFVFFSLSGTKLPHYMLYGMSGMFILMATWAPASRFWTLLPAALWFVFLALLPFALERLQPHVTDAYYRAALADVGTQFGVGYYIYCALALVVVLIFMLERRLASRLKWTLVGLIVTTGLSLFLVPAGAAVQQQPIKEAALLARSQGWEVIMWRLNAPSFSVYYGRPTVSREPRSGDLVITKAKRLAELQGLSPETLYARNGIVLARVH